jgi:hypothetical protein
MGRGLLERGNPLNKGRDGQSLPIAGSPTWNREAPADPPVSKPGLLFSQKLQAIKSPGLSDRGDKASAEADVPSSWLALTFLHLAHGRLSLSL